MSKQQYPLHWLKNIHKESYLWSLCCCQYDEEMAKDVLQTAYLKVYEKETGFAGKSQGKTWFFSIIKYTALDVFRKRRLKTVSLHEAMQLTNDLSDEANDYSKKIPIKEILNRLSMQQREVLTLVFYNDLTIEAAAEVLGISIGTARSHYSRAKANFKKWLVHK